MSYLTIAVIWWSFVGLLYRWDRAERQRLEAEDAVRQVMDS